MSKAPDTAIKTVRTDWSQVVLVCRKCSKKLDGGFGEDGDQSLRKALRRAAGGGKGRKASIGVIEVGCFDLCPRNAVVAANASTPGQWLVVPRGTPIAAVSEQLGLMAPA
ncbi:MAG TPA: (2Fe-2S) ferredoxin domain-containing protein [Caulobacter sp.]|nr:(2Fe-2S) ferredoxin domain-containing protein [Caulobacter sp.]